MVEYKHYYSFKVTKGYYINYYNRQYNNISFKGT